jgi:hypothetical protein
MPDVHNSLWFQLNFPLATVFFTLVQMKEKTDKNDSTFLNQHQY